MWKALQCHGKSIPEYWRLKKIAKQVRNGITPRNCSKETVWEALRVTRPRNSVELFGFLEAEVRNPDGTLKMDLGLQSVKKVTTAFCKVLVDALVQSSAAALVHSYYYHKMGTGSTAEASGDSNLVTPANVYGSGVQTHGASSLIYSTSGIITAISALSIREHGLFNASTGGTLLDRSTVATIDLITDDQVTWTYSLTINTET